MNLSMFLLEPCVFIDAIAQSKKAVLEQVSTLLCQQNPALCHDVLFNAYWQREQLGSTAIGHGVVIPHIHIKCQKVQWCFLRLLHPVDFGAEDKQPADLVMALMVPEGSHDTHLKLLRAVVKLFSCDKFRRHCRNLNDSTVLSQWLCENIAASEHYEANKSSNY